MSAPGCSTEEMGSRPERRMGHPAPEMQHPARRTCVHERAVGHPALLMGHPERRSGHPEAVMEHPGRNGAAIFRGKSAIPGRKAVPGAWNSGGGAERGVVGERTRGITGERELQHDFTTNPRKPVSQKKLGSTAAVRRKPSTWQNEVPTAAPPPL
jgi:hypothetical protein